MIGSRHAFLAIALLATAASMPGAAFAHASSPAHVSGSSNAIRLHERSPLANTHLPYNRKAQPQRQVEDPFADLILG